MEQGEVSAKGAASDSSAAGAAAGSGAAKGAAQKQGGSKQQQQRKQGAALLPRRNKSQQHDADAAGAAQGDQLGGKAANAAGGDGGSGSIRGKGAAAAGGGKGGRDGLVASMLDHHARNQVLAGRDPGEIKAAHGGAADTKSGDAALPAAGDDLSADPASLADAHKAALAAQKAQHVEKVLDASSATAPQPAGGGDGGGLTISGSGIAGAVSGMTAEFPTDAESPLDGGAARESGLLAGDSLSGDALADGPQAGAIKFQGGLNGVALADAHDAVASATEMAAQRRSGGGGGRRTGGVIDGGAAGRLLDRASAVAPKSAAAAEAQDSALGAKNGARDLVCLFRVSFRPRGLKYRSLGLVSASDQEYTARVLRTPSLILATGPPLRNPCLASSPA